MRAIFSSLALAALFLGANSVGPSLAAAQTPDAAQASDNGRYAMTPADGGFLKLDTRTGQTSFCKVESGVARCALAADERAAYEAEIARLKGARPAPSSSGPAASPDEKQLETALSYAERFMRMMMRVFREESGQN